MLAAQEVKIDKMAETGKESSWKDVVKRKQRKRVADERPTLGLNTDTPPAETVSTRRRKARPAGILIDAGSDADFLALAKKIKDGIDKNTVGNNIVGITKTRNGSLLIKVRGDQPALDINKDEVSRAAGGEAAIRLL